MPLCGVKEGSAEYQYPVGFVRGDWRVAVNQGDRASGVLGTLQMVQVVAVLGEGTKEM